MHWNHVNLWQNNFSLFIFYGYLFSQKLWFVEKFLETMFILIKLDVCSKYVPKQL